MVRKTGLIFFIMGLLILLTGILFLYAASQPKASTRAKLVYDRSGIETERWRWNECG